LPPEGPAVFGVAGFFHFPASLKHETTVTRKATKMNRTALDLKRPYRGGDYRLLRAGRRGTYWQANDGRWVQLAAPEGEPTIERWRVSILGVLIAIIAGGAARR
jgi:hypothetical protein